MTFEEMQHRVTTASALGLLLIASPSYAQTGAAATKEPTMTSQLQYTTPTSAQPRAAATCLARRAVPAYNLLHSPVVPALLLVAAVAGLGAYWAVAAITWAAHIAIDRGVGYGLRTRDGWQRG